MNKHSPLICSRCLGFFLSRHWIRSLASGERSEGRWNSACMTRFRVLRTALVSKGGWPTSMVYSMQPSDHTSVSSPCGDRIATSLSTNIHSSSTHNSESEPAKIKTAACLKASSMLCERASVDRIWQRSVGLARSELRDETKPLRQTSSRVEGLV